jgi:hypothetical protein
MTLWRCSPKHSLPGPHVDCGMSKPGGRPRIPTRLRRLPANGRLLANAAGPPQHPAIAHVRIHALEMSNEPARAIVSADTLATLCPDVGHMNHMPAHIYVFCGECEKARTEKAIRADDAYAENAGSMDFYVTARCHDIHLLMFTCMFLGQYDPAKAAADKMQRIITRDILTVQDRPKRQSRPVRYTFQRAEVAVSRQMFADILCSDRPAAGTARSGMTERSGQTRQAATAEVRLEQRKVAGSGPARPSVLPFWLSTGWLGRIRLQRASPRRKIKRKRSRIWGSSVNEGAEGSTAGSEGRHRYRGGEAISRSREPASCETRIAFPPRRAYPDQFGLKFMVRA